MERSIPHIRSIFSTSSRKKSTSDTQDLCQYERSPSRSRRKPNKDLDDRVSPKRSYGNGKENLTKAGETEVGHGGRKPGSRSNYNTYTSKTLTEKDMKHLERHLSMKKTIRKQISRNLAQAFLDNPDIFEPAGDVANNNKQAAGYRGKAEDDKPGEEVIAKTEQNVLDLLKISIDDRDSGHSSPTHEHLEDTDYDEEDEAEEVGGWRSSKHRGSDTRGLVEDRPKLEPEKKSSSIWKMFSPRHKGKR